MLEWMEATSIATWVRESGSLWSYPLVVTLHTVGLSMLVGGSVAIDLRLLGVAPSIPLAPLARLFRVLWTGFVINTASGLLLFMAAATTKGVQTIFWIKLFCIICGVITVVLIQRRIFGDRAALDGGALPASAPILAVISLIVWAGAIVAGRLMAYL